MTRDYENVSDSTIDTEDLRYMISDMISDYFDNINEESEDDSDLEDIKIDLLDEIKEIIDEEIDAVETEEKESAEDDTDLRGVIRDIIYNLFEDDIDLEDIKTGLLEEIEEIVDEEIEDIIETNTRFDEIATKRSELLYRFENEILPDLYFNNPENVISNIEQDKGYLCRLFLNTISKDDKEFFDNSGSQWNHNPYAKGEYSLSKYELDGTQVFELVLSDIGFIDDRYHRIYLLYSNEHSEVRMLADEYEATKQGKEDVCSKLKLKEIEFSEGVVKIGSTYNLEEKDNIHELVKSIIKMKNKD